jgi:hypothetical protein
MSTPTSHVDESVAGMKAYGRAPTFLRLRAGSIDYRAPIHPGTFPDAIDIFLEQLLDPMIVALATWPTPGGAGARSIGIHARSRSVPPAVTDRMPLPKTVPDGSPCAPAHRGPKPRSALLRSSKDIDRGRAS